MTPAKTWTLIGPDGQPYSSTVPGTLGGHRGGKRYGRLDCRAALRAIAQGGYVKERVFFADEPTAIRAGYRPCAVCMPNEYATWKARHRRVLMATPLLASLALASEPLPSGLYEITVETDMPHLEENLRYALLTKRAACASKTWPPRFQCSSTREPLPFVQVMKRELRGVAI